MYLTSDSRKGSSPSFCLQDSENQLYLQRGMGGAQREAQKKEGLIELTQQTQKDANWVENDFSLFQMSE